MVDSNKFTVEVGDDTFIIHTDFTTHEREEELHMSLIKEPITIDDVLNVSEYGRLWSKNK